MDIGSRIARKNLPHPGDSTPRTVTGVEPVTDRDIGPTIMLTCYQTQALCLQRMNAPCVEEEDTSDNTALTSSMTGQKKAAANPRIFGKPRMQAEADNGRRRSKADK